MNNEKNLYRIDTILEVWLEESNKFEVISRDIKAKSGSKAAIEECNKQNQNIKNLINEYEVIK